MVVRYSAGRNLPKSAGPYPREISPTGAARADLVALRIPNRAGGRQLDLSYSKPS